jgi:hypothetical protein
MLFWNIKLQTCQIFNEKKYRTVDGAGHTGILTRMWGGMGTCEISCTKREEQCTKTPERIVFKINFALSLLTFLRCHYYRKAKRCQWSEESCSL